MNIWKRILAGGALCAVALGLAAPAFAETIRLGLMCPLTGKWASEGQDMKNIVSLLVDETNAAGGINGKKVELVVEDDAGDPRTAALAAQKLAGAGVVAVIGTYGSAVTEASQNIIAEAGLVHVGTGSTSIRLTEKGLPLFFRTCPRDDAQGAAAAEAIVKGGFKKVALLHDKSSYAKGLADESRKALEKAGVEIVFYDALTPGERDYTAILTKLKSATPDVVFFTGYYPETGMLLRQKKEMGWDVPMMGGDAANHQDLVKIAGADAAKGYFFISPPLPQDMDTQEARHFLEAYKARYQSVPVSVWAVVAGDAYKVIEAALAAGKTDPEDMAQWLKQLKDMPGLTGKLGFDEKGDRVGEFYRSYMVDEQGKFILLPQK
ncbi:MAG TPA: branched-chain amino acid ABC transporter substrate-binding protein [Candidatus Desulfovibrio gallistercoris]|uniref:branched-chain amino acid ABC transporter substrate-binding protein n=1 Tax=uncultured Desulfovibrio sp. TaxID=167968 RepID=UPI001F868FB9|nr:branched-chain amino acid ABC transporter substrate-binding protein [uncultured Desulfovibrio sp.]HJA75467.1 branched-chain amino acid ABC transporter substrate-binding protein [Candidatus Desulfovibrio gallistercoris]